MFDYARNMQLAVKDMARRSAVKAAAGGIMVVGLGFLLAALWSWLATELGWGSTYASLAIGGAFLVIGLIAISAAGRVRHQPPTTDDLKREVEARISLVADAASNRARAEAMRIVDTATGRVSDIVDRAAGSASRFVSETEHKVRDLTRDTAAMAGLTPENIEAAKETAQDYAEKAQRAANSNPGSMAKLIGAFAVGVAVASKLRGRKRDRYDDEFYDDYDDDLLA